MLIPKEGSVWEHNRTGELYKVLAVSNLRATKSGWDPTVVYMDGNRTIWSRPLDEWLNKYSPPEN